jgi:hypothetical protein
MVRAARNQAGVIVTAVLKYWSIRLPLSRQEGVSPSSLSQNRTWNSRFIRLVLFLLKNRVINSSLSVGWVPVNRNNPSPSLHSHYRNFITNMAWSDFLKA